MTNASSTNDMPMDRAYLASVSGDDTEFERELTESFLDVSPDLIAELRSAVRGGDPVQVQRSAHGLKGSARAIGAEPVAAVCERLETMGREGRLDGAEDDVSELERRYAALSAYIHATWLS